MYTFIIDRSAENNGKRRAGRNRLGKGLKGVLTEMKRTDRIQFDSPFTKQLYLEISAIQDVSVIDRPYMTRDYIWAVWQKIYKANFGCTRYVLYDNEKGA